MRRRPHSAHPAWACITPMARRGRFAGHQKCFRTGEAPRYVLMGVVVALVAAPTPIFGDGTLRGFVGTAGGHAAGSVAAPMLTTDCCCMPNSCRGARVPCPSGGVANVSSTGQCNCTGKKQNCDAHRPPTPGSPCDLSDDIVECVCKGGNVGAFCCSVEAANDDQCAVCTNGTGACGSCVAGYIVHQGRCIQGGATAGQSCTVGDDDGPSGPFSTCSSGLCLGGVCCAGVIGHCAACGDGGHCAECLPGYRRRVHHSTGDVECVIMGGTDDGTAPNGPGSECSTDDGCTSGKCLSACCDHSVDDACVRCGLDGSCRDCKDGFSLRHVESVADDGPDAWTCQSDAPADDGTLHVPLWMAAAIGGGTLFLFTVVVLVVARCRRRKSRVDGYKSVPMEDGQERKKRRKKKKRQTSTNSRMESLMK